MDIRIPNLGDGVDHATVIAVLVSPGQKIEKDQTLVELETEKATAPVPSTQAGTVGKILVKPGDKVSPGTIIVSLAEDPVGVTGRSPLQESPAPATPPAAPKAASYAPVRAATAPAAAPRPAGGTVPPAGPSVRRMAALLGIDLSQVQGSESGGRVTMEDLRGYIAWLQSGSHAAAGASPGAAPTPAPKAAVDFAKWGPVARKPASSLRKKIGERMTEAWRTIPHVTQFDEADLTRVMELRKKHKPAFEKKNANLTPTIFVMAAVVKALKKYPQFNASLDETTGDIIHKEYWNLGVAVDTEGGLIVPVVKNADRKSLLELAVETAQLAEKCRKRTVSLEELQGGTFTLSNLGSFGVGPFTPIVNPPEVAILALARGVEKPVVREKKVEIRMVLPLGLSYDHRVIDGADGARFIREVISVIENFDEAQVKA